MSIFKRIIDAFEDISEKANHKTSIPFHQIEKIAVDFLRSNSSIGFVNPGLLELTIDEQKNEQVIKLTAYYKNAATDKYIGRDISRKFTEITNVPVELKEKLKATGQLQIKFSDPSELVMGSEVNIQKAIDYQSFERLVKTWQKEVSKSNNTILSQKMTIEDKVFKKTVQVIFKIRLNEKDDIKVKSAAFMDILNLPQEVSEILSEKGCIELELE
jgi:hypothetical protein